jgi:2,3-bisphosphoglycerate-independent phosphoglycerate mutase
VSGLREILVIPDGAAEHPNGRPTSLELARTPVLDALASRGEVSSHLTTPPGLKAGSEAGIATLLGATLTEQPSRGLIEAAAAGMRVSGGRRAWRVDLYSRGRRHVPSDAARVRRLLQAELASHEVHHLRGHRFLAVGTAAPAPAQLGIQARVWGGEGSALPEILDDATVVVCASGAAAGVARMMGAAVIVPPGATGAADTDLRAKADAARGAARAGAARVVVHVGWPDEAAHELDRRSKIEALERIDSLLLGPLEQTALELGAVLQVCPDHGTDPDSGEHLGGPMPRVRAGAGVARSGPDRLSERMLLEHRA